MNLYKELEWRGIIKQITDPNVSQALATPKTVYCGFDPTSDSLHVGSLLPLITLRRFLNAGHTPIALIGGATGMIGDPSGKTQERSLLDDATIDKNITGISQIIYKILNSESHSIQAKIRNNAEWTQNVSFIQFLRDIGKHFTVNYMVAKESVRARLEDREHGISYTEFSYMLLQAFDYYVLHEKEDCTLQIGGSDQWGNITAGIELIRRITGKSEGVYGMTHPLVMKSDGSKFGKTEQGTIWLDAKKTSPYRFYQFFIQTPDAEVLTYLRYFTFYTQDEILALEKTLKLEPEKRKAQIALAQSVTKLIHGENELKKAEQASQALFGESIKDLDESTLLDVLSEAPSTTKSISTLSSGSSTLIDLLTESGLCSSKGNARKDVQSGGIYINNARVSDTQKTIVDSDLLYGKYLILRKGKRNYHLISFK